jgi:hypothetical protein
MMRDPERLLDGGSAFERSLLRSGRAEDPERDLERRVLAAVALAPAAPVGGSADLPRPPPASHGPVASSTSALGWLTRSRGLALAAAVVGLGVVVAASRGSHREPAPVLAPLAPPSAAIVPSAALPPAPPPSVALPEIVVTPDALPSAPLAAAPPLASAARPADPPAASSIEREIELLDAAKSALGASDTSAAARQLDAYDAEFARGALRPERTVLRIRILLAEGKREAARKMADDFVATHPGSVHEKRIASLLAD